MRQSYTFLTIYRNICSLSKRANIPFFIYDSKHRGLSPKTGFLTYIYSTISFRSNMTCGGTELSFKDEINSGNIKLLFIVFCSFTILFCTSVILQNINIHLFRRRDSRYIYKTNIHLQV